MTTLFGHRVIRNLYQGLHTAEQGPFGLANARRQFATDMARYLRDHALFLFDQGEVADIQSLANELPMSGRQRYSNEHGYEEARIPYHPADAIEEAQRLIAYELSALDNNDPRKIDYLSKHPGADTLPQNQSYLSFTERLRTRRVDIPLTPML